MTSMLDAPKRCKKCLAHLPADQFRLVTNHGKKSRRGACIECERAYFRSPEYKVLDSNKQDRYRENGKFYRNKKVSYNRKKEKKPDVIRGYSKYKEAIRSGRLVRPEACENCGTSPPRTRNGSSSIQGHHDDYTSPLDVKWWCKPCRSEYHRTGKLPSPASNEGL